jgi:hypothetical protein
MHPTEALRFVEENPSARHGPESARLEKHRGGAGSFEPGDPRSRFTRGDFGSGVLPEIGGERRWKEQGACGRGLHVAVPRE